MDGQKVRQLHERPCSLAAHFYWIFPIHFSFQLNDLPI